MTVPSWRTVPDNTLTAHRNTSRSSLSTMILNDKYVRNLLAPAQQPKLATVQGCREGCIVVLLLLLLKGLNLTHIWCLA